MMFELVPSGLVSTADLQAISLSSMSNIFQALSYVPEGVSSPAPAIASNLSRRRYLFVDVRGYL